MPTDDDGRVEAFLEKAEGEAPTNRINAGAYVLERDVVEPIPRRPRGLVRARGVPGAGRATGSTATRAEGYWIDIGTPERYLEATWDLLAGRVELDAAAARRDRLAGLRGLPRWPARTSGPQSVLGRHCSVGTDARVERSVLHDRVLVGADAAVVESVLAERVRVGERARSSRARWSGPAR